MYVPFGIGAATYVAIVALISLAVIAFRRRLPPWAAAAAGTLVLSMPIFFVSLLEVGRLSALDYASAAAFVVLFTFVGTAAAIAIGRGLGVAGEVISSAGIALAILIFESLTGWPSTLTPLLGGSALDGGRYYGMPNVEIGLMLGASVMVAYRLGHIWGAALIAACGLLAGLPWTWAGANLGASVTLFSAAGLWFGLGSAKRVFSLRTVLATGTVTIVGSAIVLLTNRLWPGSPTHITNFISGTGRTAGGIAHTIVERLGVGVRLIRRNAFALIPVLGVPAAIVLVVPPSAVSNARHG